MNNWNSGWRTLVTWDDIEKVYKYQNHSIIPLTYDEQVTMPMHLQNEYYWDEISYIDKIIESENRTSNVKFDPTKTAQYAFDEWWNMVEEM